jgi:sensor histidine kinase regulating citrate/malate metabolism
MRDKLTRGGLRGRLLVAFVVTSMLTLAVVGAIVLGPLQTQLRDQSVETLTDALVASSGEFSAALRADPAERSTRIINVSSDLRQRVDTRVLVDVDDDEVTLPEFTYDSDF